VNVEILLHCAAAVIEATDVRVHRLPPTRNARREGSHVGSEAHRQEARALFLLDQYLVLRAHSEPGIAPVQKLERLPGELAGRRAGAAAAGGAHREVQSFRNARVVRGGLGSRLPLRPHGWTPAERVKTLILFGTRVEKVVQ
jgi:hypothetical protein